MYWSRIEWKYKISKVLKVCAYLQHPNIRRFFFNLRESQDGYIVKDCKALNFSKALPYLYSSNISQQRIFVSWAKVLYIYILIHFSRIHFEKANSISNTYLGILQSEVESYKMGFWPRKLGICQKYEPNTNLA